MCVWKDFTGNSIITTEHKQKKCRMWCSPFHNSYSSLVLKRRLLFYTSKLLLHSVALEGAASNLKHCLKGCHLSQRFEAEDYKCGVELAKPLQPASHLSLRLMAQGYISYCSGKPT